MRLSNRGFTLIEITIASAVLMIGLLAVTELFRNVRDSTRVGESIMELSSLGAVIRESVRFDSTCDSAVTALNTSGFDSTSILSGNKTIRLGLPGVLGDSNPADDVLENGTNVRKLEITSVRLIDAVDIGGGRFYSNIELAGRESLRDLQFKPVIVGGFFFTASGGAITSCGARGIDRASLCTEMGCTYDIDASPACRCPTVDLSCPSQQFLTGVDGSGQLICRPIGNGACPSGQFLRSVGIGTSDCVSLPM